MKEFEDKFWDSINSLIDGKSGEDIAPPPIERPILPRPHSGAANLTYSFLNSGLQPPGFFLKEEWKAQASVVTSKTNEVVTITANIMMASGEVQKIFKQVTTSSTTTLTMDLPEGFLLTLSISCTQATLRCETYVRLNIIGQNSDFIFTPLAGYVSTARPISFPPVFIEEAYSGLGVSKIDNLTVDVANSTFSYTCPANRILKVRAVSGVLTAVAGGSNLLRYLLFQFCSSLGTPYFYVPSSLGINDGLSMYYMFGTKGDSNLLVDTATIYATASIPEVVLQAGEKIILTAFTYGTDTCNTNRINFEEFLTL